MERIFDNVYKDNQPMKDALTQNELCRAIASARIDRENSLVSRCIAAWEGGYHHGQEFQWGKPVAENPVE